MFKIQEVSREVDGKPFGVADYVRLFVRTDAAFARNQAALFAGARIDAKPTEVESADMAILRAALETPSSGYCLTPALAAAPFVRAILDAKEE